MIKIVLSKQFRKFFKKRISFNSSLVKKYQIRLELFINNPQDPILKSHALKGKKHSFRAFS